jgi:hypothetical protein
VGYEDELRDPLDRDNWEQREVYAAFGVAVYFCQVLETGLVNYLGLLMRMKSGAPMSEAEVDDLLGNLLRNTFGQNINKVRQQLGNEGRWILDDEMRETLELRNQLVHRWMRERVILQDNSSNRQAMVAELEAATARLQQADELLVQRTQRLMASAGVSLEEIQAEYERVSRLAELGQPDPEAPPYFTPPPNNP